jgi:RimJ/RimL family protein N-acetyltransferase
MEIADGAIVLRPWQQEDAEVVYAACQDSAILHWIPMIPRPYTRGHAEAFVTGATGLGPYQFAIVAQQRVVGSIGLRLDRTGTGRIGYWCAPAARRRGIATRALRMLCGYALDEFAS